MKKLIIIISMLIISAFAFANHHNPFVVGMELEYPPFETIDEDGNPMGASVEIAKALGEKLGREVVIENMSYPGLIPALISGKVDAVISSMTINEDRAKKVDFSLPYTTSQLVMLVNNQSSVASPNDLNDKNVKVAIKAGTVAALWLDANAPMADIRTFDKESQAVLDVAQGKSDVFIYDPLAVVRHQQKYPNTTKTVLTPLPNVSGWGIAIRKGQPELLSDINEFVTKAKTDGTFDKIRNEFLKEKAEAFEKETGMEFFF